VGREKSTEIKNNRVQQHESFSTSATAERLKLLGQNLSTNDWVQYQDLKDYTGQAIGTKVTVKIKL
jgi:hypothetical protein